MGLPRAKAKQPLFLRQPPPPIRRHTVGSLPTSGMIDSLTKSVSTFEEENNSNMADENNCSYEAAKTRPYYFRRCNRNTLKTPKIESLPDELILEILVRVPAEDIYNAARLVCRKWYKMAHTHNFIHAHLQQQTHGLFVQCWGEQTLIAMGKDDRIEMSKLNYEFKEEVKSSCNGLVLETRDNFYNLHITNPATKQHFALPPFPTNVFPYGYAIAYASASMEYKVVRSLLTDADYFKADKFSSGYFVPRDDCVAVLTVGVDKEWTRRVRTNHLSPKAMYLLFSVSLIPLTTDGFVHWVDDGYSEYVVTLNVETEIITQFPIPPSLPRDDGDDTKLYHYLPMGSHLSLLVDGTRLSWEAWEMNPETGEWTKMPDIDLERFFARTLDCILMPLGWLKFGEVLIFSVGWGESRFDSCATRHFIAYNVRRHEFELFELTPGLYSFLVHRSSLVWMDGCKA